MIVVDIRSFYMTAWNGERYSANLPASMYSVLIDAGVIPEPYYRDNVERLTEFLPRTAEFTFESDVDAVTLSQKNVMLRLRGLLGVADISVNGAAVFRSMIGQSDYIIDVKQHLRVGRNILSFAFSPTQSSDPFSRDVGILGGLSLLAFSKKIIDKVWVEQHHDGGRATLDITVDELGYDENSQVMATLTSPGGAVSFAALSRGRGSIIVNDPNLWWPQGLGLQNLYRLTVNLYSDGMIEDSREIRVGLRTVEVVENSECGLGLSVNGVPFFAFGSEYVSEDLIKPRITPERTRKLISNAAKVGCNLLCVSPSAGVPGKALLDSCDANGILLWQQLPKPTGDKESYRALVGEYISAVFNHPCLAFVSATGSGCDVSDVTIPEGISYISNPERLCSHKAGEERGLAHGFGFESVPNEKSLREFTAPADRNIFSYVMDKHTGGTAAGINIVRFAAEDFLLAESFSDFAYMSDVASTRQIESTVSRLRMARGRCMGAIISTLNDSRPTVSASSIDYYGRWKAQHYRTARVFAPVLVYARLDDTRVEFLVSNERRAPLACKLEFSIRDAANRQIMSSSVDVRLDPMCANAVYTYDFADAVKGHEREYYLAYSLNEGLSVLSKGTLLFTKPKFFNFIKPQFEVSISGTGHNFDITLHSDVFAGFVEFDFVECDAVFERNYFDITDSGAYRVSFRTEEAMSLERLRRELTIRSVYDIGIEEAATPVTEALTV